MENTVNVGQPQTVQVPNYSGVNIQIFNPSVVAPGAAGPGYNVNAPTYTTAPSYPQNYYTQNLAQPIQPVKTEETDKKKTEKRDIVELTDEYIKTLENYLNNQDKEIRLMGAKQVLVRLQEDESRKDDPALNALVNKMLQDPSQAVRFIAMAALESKIVAGNDLTVGLLQGIQGESGGVVQGRIQGKAAVKDADSLKASNILLRMAGKTTQKEFEVKDSDKKSKTEK